MQRLPGWCCCRHRALAQTRHTKLQGVRCTGSLKDSALAGLQQLATGHFCSRLWRFCSRLWRFVACCCSVNYSFLHVKPNLPKTPPSVRCLCDPISLPAHQRTDQTHPSPDHTPARLSKYTLPVCLHATTTQTTHHTPLTSPPLFLFNNPRPPILFLLLRLTSHHNHHQASASAQTFAFSSHSRSPYSRS